MGKVGDHPTGEFFPLQVEFSPHVDNSRCGGADEHRGMQYGSTMYVLTNKWQYPAFLVKTGYFRLHHLNHHVDRYYHASIELPWSLQGSS